MFFAFIPLSVQTSGRLIEMQATRGQKGLWVCLFTNQYPFLPPNNLFSPALVGRSLSFAKHFLPFVLGRPIWIPRLCCALPELCSWGWGHHLALAQWVSLQETAWGHKSFFLQGVTIITWKVSTFIILGSV